MDMSMRRTCHGLGVGQSTLTHTSNPHHVKIKLDHRRQRRRGSADSLAHKRIVAKIKTS